MKRISIAAAVLTVAFLIVPAARAEEPDSLRPAEEQILAVYQNLAGMMKNYQTTEKELIRLLCQHHVRRTWALFRQAKDAQTQKDMLAASNYMVQVASELDRLINEGGEPFQDVKRQVYGQGQLPRYVVTGELSTKMTKLRDDVTMIAEALRPTGFVKPGRMGDIDRLMDRFRLLEKELGL